MTVRASLSSKHVVRLSAAERERLEGMIRTGRRPAQMLTKARILLASDVDGPGLSDGRIVEMLGTSRSSVERTRRRLVEEGGACQGSRDAKHRGMAGGGLEAALARKTQDHPSREPIFDGEAEAKLIALACSPPPKGRTRWTLRLLEAKVVELAIVERASDNTIGRTLKKALSNRIAAGNGRSQPEAPTSEACWTGWRRGSPLAVPPPIGSR